MAPTDSTTTSRSSRASTNALNKNYYTAGFLTQSVYTPNGTFITDPNDWTNENNVVPSAPREFWGGVRVTF